jgi:hypothetical protein
MTTRSCPQHPQRGITKRGLCGSCYTAHRRGGAITTGLVDVSVARNWVRHLTVVCGWTQDDVAKAARVARRTVGSVLGETRSRINVDTATRLLALQPYVRQRPR